MIDDTGETSRRVLIADDDAALRNVLAGLLEDLGWSVVGSVGDASTAVSESRRLDPDAVILDHRMPGLSGSSAVPLIDAPVILLSAYDDPSIQEAAVASGAVAYLVKGCSAGEIDAALTAALAIRR